MTDENENTQLLATVQKYSKPLLSIVKAVGPFILSQSKLARENYENFKLNKERLEAISVFLKEESHKLAEERSKWRGIMYESSGFARVQAENNYAMITRELNKLSTIDKIKDFIGDDEEINPTNSISDAWIDKFNNLASSLNEEWRKKLLAKAFANELKKEGSINLSVLNCIGSFDEKTFRYFGILVNNSLRFHGFNIIPHASLSLKRLFLVDGRTVSQASIDFALSHLNLIDTTSRRFLKGEKNKPIYIRYGRNVLELINNYGEADAAQIEACFFTSLGNSIAQLYERELTAEGYENFEIMKLSIQKSLAVGIYDITEQYLSDEEFETLGI
ncbi:TPA: DUF2806 domain-containing protein [Klebsiella quasipneumoniae]|nr:DUF2806 domain-containing protein [Klebsiella quasipneumoniae]